MMYDIPIIDINHCLAIYRIAQILVGENFGKFGETNAIRQYLPSQIPDSLK